MADAKDGVAKQEYAPRVISGELAFLIRSALNTAIYGEQGLGWKGTSWRIAQSIKRSDIGGKPVQPIARKLLGMRALVLT